MKKIKVLYFGSLSETVGSTEEIIEFAGNLEDLKSILDSKYPSLKENRHSIAVNQQIITEKTELNEGDEVALLPPFAGG